MSEENDFAGICYVATEMTLRFFYRILWTASHQRTGMFNIHNFPLWEYVNPGIVRQDRLQQQFGINMWAGIIERKLIRPF